MLLMMLEKKISIDYIVFFDTGWEFPGMIEHIDKLEKYIDRKIVRLKYKTPFDEGFKKWGFASFNRRKIIIFIIAFYIIFIAPRT